MSAQYCTFRLDELTFGVEIARVQEVLQAQQMTRVPTAHSVVAGLLNLRGRVVTALDLRRRLELSDGDQDRPRAPIHVVVRTAEGEVSLLMDAIGEVADVDPDAVEPLPQTFRAGVRELVTGAYDLHGRLLLLLDIDAAVHLSTSPRADGRPSSVSALSTMKA